MKEWLQKIGYTVGISRFPFRGIDAYRQGRRYSRLEHHTRGWYQRQRQHLCIRPLPPTRMGQANRIPPENRSLHFTGLDMHSRAHPNKRTTNLRGFVRQILFRYLGPSVSAGGQGLFCRPRKTASISSITRITGHSHLLPGRNPSDHLRDSSWRRI